MRDKLCSSTDASIPLNCETTYSINVKSLSELASSFSIKYQELCHEINMAALECPNSNAEKKMKRIASSVKSSSSKFVIKKRNPFKIF